MISRSLLALLISFFLGQLAWAVEATVEPTPIEADQMVSAREAYKAQDYVQAIEQLLQVLKTDQDAETYYYLGLSYYGLGTYTLAIDAFEMAQSLYEQSPVDLIFSLGLAYYYAGELNAAQDYLNQVLDDPRSSLHLRQVAEEQLLLSFRDQSQDYQQGLLAFQSADYQEALNAFQRVLNLLPDSAELNYFLGLSAYHLMDYALSAQYLKRVKELAPDSEYGISASQTLEVVAKLAQNLPPQSFYGSVTLGNFGDSNVNYGGAANNNVSAENTQLESALQDVGSNLNVQLNYALSAVSNLSYNYALGIYWGLNDDPERTLNSYDYNLQQHNIALFHRIPIQDWIELYLNTHGSLQVLAGNPFFTEAGLRPTLTFYETERLITRAYIDLATERYATLQARDNWTYALALNQYIYLWDSQSWLRFGYRFQNVLARDNIRSVLQESDNTLFETEFLAAASRSENQLGMAFGWPLWQASLELGSRFDFLLYNKPDVYRQYRYSVNPLTGLPLPREELTDFSREIYREDTRLTFYLSLEWPIMDHWKLLGRYQRVTNVSNISPLDIRTLTNRSYLKDELEFGIQYLF